MNVTRDVVIDLLPMYFSGEASADTKSLVAEFLRHDPDLARMSGRFAGTREAVEVVALQRARTHVRYRNQLIGFATYCSLVPLAFKFDRGGIVWWMPRDHPALAAAFAAGAVACWLGVYLLGLRTRRTGL